MYNRIGALSVKKEKEAIHSGHFMVSHFEAEAQDDEDEVAVPLPEALDVKTEMVIPIKTNKEKMVVNRKCLRNYRIGIDTSLSKLFQCMSLAYRQKLTSPKWNRFRGIRLRWKDKIRLNNVIWRCWHLQFIKKENTLICQFASPLDVDTHNKPEAVVLEGKYWKRKLAAVTAEYKKWRMFYRNQSFGHNKESSDMLSELELMAWKTTSTEENPDMMVDEDYMGLMSDTLFSAISNTPFVFPDTREIAKAGLADFIQPSLGPLQPNLDDYMDTFEPFQELISGKLATVPEEQNIDSMYRNDGWYSDFYFLGNASNVSQQTTANEMNLYQSLPTVSSASKDIMNNTRQVQPYCSEITTYNDNQLYNVDTISKKKIETTNVPKMNQQAIVDSFNISGTAGVQLSTGAKIIQEPVQSSNYKSIQPVAQNFQFSTPISTNIKYTSQASNSYKTLEPQREDKIKKTPGVRGRPRSRSNTREPIKKPPLISAISDPSLLNSANSTLLTQLLKNSDNSNATLHNKQVNQGSELKLAIKNNEDNNSRINTNSVQSTTLIVTNPVKLSSTPQNLNNVDPLFLNPIGNPTSPILEGSQSLNSPTSSQSSSIGSPTREGSFRDPRRACHIHAEQKRRYNIKNGFDMIHSLIPYLNQNPNSKLSKAAMLQKGAEYIKQLKQERNLLKNEMDNLRQQIDTLNTSISNCQSLLPATGAPVSRRRNDKIEEMFDDYVRRRTMEDWKFWIFSLLFRPLLTSFNNFVSTSSMDDLYRSTMLWIEQHCTLVDLRPIVLNSLRDLCTKTDVLSEPDKLPEEARRIVLKDNHH